MKKIKIVIIIWLGTMSSINAQITLAEVEGNSVINGKIGVGTDSLVRELTTVGWIRAAYDQSQISNIELWHGGLNGFLNVNGVGNLDFRKNGLTQMTMTSAGNFGVGITDPIEKLEVTGGIRLESASSETPAAGTLRWNDTTQDFEGYDGAKWLSLTSGCTSSGSMNTGPPVSPMCCEVSFTNSSGNNNDNFGYSVALDGNNAVVGAFSTTEAYFYNYDNNVWGLDTVLSVNIEVLSADLDQGYAVLGHPYDNNAKGSAGIYQKVNNKWQFKQNLTASDGFDSDQFGWSVGISGNNAIIGANASISAKGKVYFFENVGGSWSEVADLQYSDGDAGDQYGRSIAISGNYALAGAPNHGHGIVVALAKSGNVWGEIDTLTVALSGNFGTSVSMDGDFAIIGASGAESNSGRAYVFKRIGNEWILQQELIASDASAVDDRFGTSVSIRGDYIVIGAPGGNSDLNGKAYIFHFDGTDWLEIEKLTDPVGLAGDKYGSSVATDSANRIVGAPGADANGDVDRGKVIFGPVE